MALEEVNEDQQEVNELLQDERLEEVKLALRVLERSEKAKDDLESLKEMKILQ